MPLDADDVGVRRHFQRLYRAVGSGGGIMNSQSRFVDGLMMVTICISGRAQNVIEQSVLFNLDFMADVGALIRCLHMIERSSGLQ